MKPPIPADVLSGGFGESEGPHWRVDSPQTLSRWGLGLFLISLTSLFVASLIGYITIRLTGIGSSSQGQVALHPALWLSTSILLLCGLVMALAQRDARRGRVVVVRRWVIIAWLMSVLFLMAQGPAVAQLALERHASLAAGQGGAEGIVYALILLHAVHVVGGLVPLSVLSLRALRKRLELRHMAAVGSCAVYWHFLEAVWLTMFAAFLIVG